MPHEIEFTNPQIKTYYQPQIIVGESKENIFKNDEIKKKKERKKESFEEVHSFKPMLLKKSLLMAEKMGDTMGRLTKGSISKSKEKINSLNNDIYGKYNFKPEINKTSMKIVKKKRDKSIEKSAEKSKPRWEELYSMVKQFFLKLLKFLFKYEEKTKEREIQKIEHDIKKGEDPELTFHPKVKKNHYIFFGFLFFLKKSHFFLEKMIWI